VGYNVRGEFNEGDDVMGGLEGVPPSPCGVYTLVSCQLHISFFVKADVKLCVIEGDGNNKLVFNHIPSLISCVIVEGRNAPAACLLSRDGTGAYASRCTGRLLVISALGWRPLPRWPDAFTRLHYL
jgi:hypothetical protein